MPWGPSSAAAPSGDRTLPLPSRPRFRDQRQNPPAQNPNSSENAWFRVRQAPDIMAHGYEDYAEIVELVAPLSARA